MQDSTVFEPVMHIQGKNQAHGTRLFRGIGDIKLRFYAKKGDSVNKVVGEKEIGQIQARSIAAIFVGKMIERQGGILYTDSRMAIQSNARRDTWPLPMKPS